MFWNESTICMYVKNNVICFFLQVISPSIYLAHFSYHNYLPQKKEINISGSFPHALVCRYTTEDCAKIRRSLRQLGVWEVDSQYYIVRFLELFYKKYFFAQTLEFRPMIPTIFQKCPIPSLFRFGTLFRIAFVNIFRILCITR